MYNPFADFVDLLNGGGNSITPARRTTTAPAPPYVPERPSQQTYTYAAPVPERPSYHTDTYVAPSPLPPNPHGGLYEKPYYDEPIYEEEDETIYVSPERPTRDQTWDPQIMYHGTPKKKSAKDIFNNNRWLVSPTNSDPGVYMTPDFETAANNYAKEDGAVIELWANPEYGKKKVTEKFYVFVIRNPDPDQYYGIDGIMPLRILDKKGNPLEWTPSTY